MRITRKDEAIDLALLQKDFFSQEILKMPGKILLDVLGELPAIEVYDLGEHTTRVSGTQKPRLLLLEPALIASYSLPGKDFAGKERFASIVIGPDIQLTLKDLTEVQVKRLRACLPLPFVLAEEASINESQSREEAEEVLVCA